MKTWYGINDTEDFVYAALIIGGLATILINGVIALIRHFRRPKPLPAGQYHVVVRNVDTPKESAALLQFEIKKAGGNNHA